MKQRRTMLIAIACGVVCALCVGGFLASVQGRASAERAEVLARFGGEQVEVCVSTRDIAAGERVDATAVETRLWVADLLPDEAVRNSADIIGRTATASILRGEVISAKRFESGHGTLDVPVGKEAVSVPAKSVQAVGGAIRAGMSVDVYSSGDAATAALLKDVVVLDASLSASASSASGSSGWVTLAVDPERVQEIIAAANRTSLYFVVPGGRGVQEGEAGAQVGGSASAQSPDADSVSQDASGARKSLSASAAAEASPVRSPVEGDAPTAEEDAPAGAEVEEDVQ